MSDELEAGRITARCLIASLGESDTRIFVACKIRCARRRRATFELWYWLGAALACRRKHTLYASISLTLAKAPASSGNPVS